MSSSRFTLWVLVTVASLAAATPGHAAKRVRAAAVAAETAIDRDRIRAFAADVAAKRALSAETIEATLARAQRVPAVQKLIMPAADGAAKNWQAYRERFIEPQRIAGGVLFWREHQSWLDKAEARWGVPPEIVVAIIGVETFYGRITGNFRIVDALATLAFHFPPGRKDRSEFFRGELEEFLLWCSREGLDPLAPRGSYAGAMGLPQFMPGSINRYGVDFDGDGHVDLRGNAADAIGSVARYLADFGWQRGQPTHYAVQPPEDIASLAKLLAPDIVPSFTATEFGELGARLEEPALSHAGLLAFVRLDNGGAAPSQVAGTANFYAITRYNWSSYYALAVASLAQALKAAR